MSLNLYRSRPMSDAVSLAELIARRRPGYSLEQAFYTAPEIFRHDLDRIYHGH